MKNAEGTMVAYPRRAICEYNAYTVEQSLPWSTWKIIEINKKHSTLEVGSEWEASNGIDLIRDGGWIETFGHKTRELGDLTDAASSALASLEWYLNPDHPIGSLSEKDSKFRKKASASIRQLRKALGK